MREIVGNHEASYEESHLRILGVVFERKSHMSCDANSGYACVLPSIPYNIRMFLVLKKIR